ncbi:hypothetical protein K2P47_01660 [Patescibacteria group bacterium]|nr:hypothetical protein [Patescibacteria group bacterium]
MKHIDILTAKVPGTTDKRRIRFCLQSFTSKMQAIIDSFFELKWRKDVTVTRWPRQNIVEVRLSHHMIRTAGFIEVTQEVRRYWRQFLQLLEKEIALNKMLLGTKP